MKTNYKEKSKLRHRLKKKKTCHVLGEKRGKEGRRRERERERKGRKDRREG